MWHLVFHLAARLFLTLLGVFFVLTGIALYPNEEGKIQSKFEDFWVKADDYQRLALSRHVRFMTQVAKMESAFFDQVFGPKLFSAQSIVISCCSSAISFVLAGSVLLRSLTHVSVVFPNLLLVGLLISLSLASVAYIFLPNHRRAQSFYRWLAAAILIFAGEWYVRLTPKTGLESWAVTYAALFVGGFCCDTIFIAATRRLLRWVGEMTRSFPIVGVLTFNLLLAVLLVAPVFVWQRSSILSSLTSPWQWLVVSAFSTVGMSNLFDFIFASLFVALAAVLLVHRALWPLLTRTLFRMQDIGANGRRTILALIGFTLMGVSGAKIPELLKELVKILGKV